MKTCLLGNRKLSQLLHCHFSTSTKLIKTKDDKAIHSCAWRNSSHQLEIINNAIVMEYKVQPPEGNRTKLTHQVAILCLVFRIWTEFLMRHLHLNGNPSASTSKGPKLPQLTLHLSNDPFVSLFYCCPCMKLMLHFWRLHKGLEEHKCMVPDQGILCSSVPCVNRSLWIFIAYSLACRAVQFVTWALHRIENRIWLECHITAKQNSVIIITTINLCQLRYSFLISHITV